jgi:hypothetical protein
MEYLTTALIWLSVFPVIQVAKTATEVQILAAQIVNPSLGLSKLSKLVFLKDLAPTGIILMQIGNASLAILIAKLVNSPQLSAQNANPSISSKDSGVLISACGVFMETTRHNLVSLTRL